MNSYITTHILDTHLGKPAANVNVLLYPPKEENPIATGLTNSNGRIDTWNCNFDLSQGLWQIKFMTQKWFTEQNLDTFYGDITISFNIRDSSQHYHIPLLLSAFGYTTYRGS